MPNFFLTEEVEKKLDLQFQNKNLLIQAFVHRSFWNENQTLLEGHNERLEFLGDSVLGLIIAEYLYRQKPFLDEGVLSMLRSQLVDAPACASYIHKLGISNYLLLGRGELMNRGKGRDSILADLFEAIIGAIYLDRGIEEVKRFIFTSFKEEIDQMIEKPQRNWKAELQDFAQKSYGEAPVYEVINESGPAHRKTFRVTVSIKGDHLAEAEGSSKKEAQTNAAKQALLIIAE